MSTTYSIWPVFLIPYNLLPWLCMKQASFILSMIIPGKQMPGNNIDVYLRPLVKELCDLWIDGVETCDSSLNETFRMRAALMWTITDFPRLGILSGWNTILVLVAQFVTLIQNLVVFVIVKSGVLWIIDISLEEITGSDSIEHTSMEVKRSRIHQ